MGAGHDHGKQAVRAGARHRARLWWAAGLLATFMLVEAAAAVGTRTDWLPGRLHT